MVSRRSGGLRQRFGRSALLAVVCVMLIGLARVFHANPVLEGLDKLFSVIGGLAGVSALYVVVRTRRSAAIPADDGDPATLNTLDVLAATVAAVWQPEQRRRRLLNPHPLPTAWTTIGPPIADHWSNIRSDGDATPLDLNGCVDLHHPDALHQVLTDPRLRGRVVILGEPGAGKTALLLRETLRLLRARKPGDRVPVLLRLSTWNPDEQQLDQWITRQLANQYASGSPIAAGQLLPLLDGLDEMPTRRRARALQAISNTFTPDHPLVLTSRSNEYLDTLTALAHTTLAAAVVLELTAVPADTAREYLQRATARHDAWAQVFHRDTTDHHGRLAAALTQPLWIDLARITYTDADQPHNNPSELLELSDTRTIHAHLLDRLIPAAYPDPPEPSPAGHVWHRADAHRYLRHLAGHMRIRTTQDIAWWELVDAVPYHVRLAYMLAGWLAVWVAVWLTFGLGIAVWVGVMGWMATSSGWHTIPTRSQIRWRRSERPLRHRLCSLAGKTVNGLVLGLALGAVAGLASGLAIGLQDGLQGGLEAGAFGFTIGFALGFVQSLAWLLNDEFIDWREIFDRTATDPLRLLRNDRRKALRSALTVALGVGFIAGLMIGLIHGLPDGLLVGFMFGLPFGLARLSTSSWISHQMARLWWYSRNRLPWPLMAFLADAHRRGLLRQAGSVYQFRHALLHDRLASQDDRHAPRTLMPH